MNIYANLPNLTDAINNIAENTHASGRELLSLCQLAGITDDHLHHIMSQWAENDNYGTVLEQNGVLYFFDTDPDYDTDWSEANIDPDNLEHPFLSLEA